MTGKKRYPRPNGRKADVDALSTLRKEYRKLQERNGDLDAQVQSLLKSHPMTDQQLAEFTTLHAQFEALNEEQNEIALFFRRNFQGEIDRGEHQGLTLSQCVNRYLGRYRAMMAEKEQSSRRQAQ